MESDSPLKSAEWLLEHLDDSNLVVLDASVAKPKTKSSDNPLSNSQIAHTRFFDIDGVFSDQSSPLPHMMTDKEHFQKEARTLGISKESVIVIYDNLGIYSSPRAWWMFKSMGHNQVYVLDGGLPHWVEKGLPTEQKRVTEFNPGNFIANPRPYYFVNADYVLQKIQDLNTCILDARSAGRFLGSQSEPRKGLRSGHIPRSKNLPFPNVLDETKMKPVTELQALFKEANASNKELIFSCGSGLTACIILLAASIAGYENLSVYDGSWSEWGQPSDFPIEV